MRKETFMYSFVLILFCGLFAFVLAVPVVRADNQSEVQYYNVAKASTTSRDKAKALSDKAKKNRLASLMNYGLYKKAIAKNKAYLMVSAKKSKTKQMLKKKSSK